MTHPFDANANAQRIATACAALKSASQARGDNPAVCDEAVIDLLADLRQFCAARCIDYESCDRMARHHFEAETGAKR